MNTKFLKCFLITMLLTLSGLTSSPSTDFYEANSFYEKGDFENAVQLYEKIISEGFESGAVYYNLANSYYKTGNIAQSVINYERALKLMPGDRDIRENLKIVRFSLVDRTEEETAVPFFTFYSDLKNLFNIHSVKRIFYTLLITLTALLSVFIIFQAAVFSKYLFILCIITAVSLSGISYIYYDIHTDHFSRYGVVSSSRVSVLSSPDESINSRELFFLHEGTKASILRSNEGWFEIELRDGKRGWIRKDLMIEI